MMEQVEVIGYEPVGKGKIRIAFSNGITCLLYRGEARTYRIQEHAFLSYNDYVSLMTDVVGKRAKKRAMHLLEQMDRTERQLRDKLIAGEYPAECVDAAIEYVKMFHYLDDYRYACTYIEYRKDKMSRGQLSMKLMQKGVSKEWIDRAMEECNEEEETGQIVALLQKKHYDAKACDQKEFMRIYQFLVRRGFKSNDILKCMKQRELFEL